MRTGFKIVKALGLLGLLVALSMAGTGCGGGSESAPLVSIPAPSSLKVSASTDEDSSGARLGVFMAQGLDDYPFLVLQNADGSDEDVVAIETGNAGPAAVLAATGTTLKYAYRDQNDNTGSFTEITVPANRVSAALQFENTESIRLNADNKQVLILGSDADNQSGIKPLDVSDPTAPDIGTTVSIAEGSSPFQNAIQLSHFAGTNICVVANNAQTIATLSCSTGAIIDTIANPSGGDNDQLLVLDDSVYVSSIGAIGLPIFYFAVDQTSGAIGGSGTISRTSLMSGFDTASDYKTAMVANDEEAVVYHAEEVTTNGSTAVFLTVVNHDDKSISDSKLFEELTGLFQNGMTLIISNVFDYLFFSQDDHVARVRLRATTGGLRQILDAVAEYDIPGVSAAGAFQGDCADDVFVLLGNAEDLITQVFSFAEDGDSVTLTEDTGLSTAIGLGIRQIASGCVDGFPMHGNLSPDSRDVTTNSL